MEGIDSQNNQNQQQHKQVLTSLDLSKNKFGDDGCRYLLKLCREKGTSIRNLGMVGCNVSVKNLKLLSDQLRCNNSILQTIGFSSDVSLAILDSVVTVENMLGVNKNKK